MVILIVVCIILGLFMLIKPQSTINIHNKLFVENDKPSDLYIICLRVAGGFIIILGITLTILLFFI